MKQRSLGSIRRNFAPWTDPDAVPFVRFRNVTKRFGAFTAVDDLSLDIYRREFFALLGASGCGKSTLLRLLAGFETPSAGTVEVDGEDLTGVPPYRRPVNMMFQSYALFPHMSVSGNIAFGLKQDGMAKSEREDRIAEVLKLVKLEDYARRRPDQLSGGQRQRVALARSLAKRPKVLLLDEPLGALDKKLREETQFELVDLQHELEMTFMMVTHDQEEAMTMADRIAIMDKGTIRQIGPPAEVYEAPRSRFVADFVGSVNIFDGQLAGKRDGRLLIDLGASGVLQIEGASERVEGEELSYAVRPEKLLISAEPLEGLNVLAGEVWDIAYFGDVTAFRIKLDNDDIVRATMINSARVSPLQLSWHDRAWVSFAPDAGVLLED